MPVKGLVHHSFCSPKLCNKVLLLPISYNQDFAAMESTRKTDLLGAKVAWEVKKDKLLWRGSHAGKAQEYKYFGWNFPKMPRAKAVEMCRFRKGTDVKFGSVHWKVFTKHKYILALAGNTYASLFKHALRSGSCILRQEERMYEWYEPFLREWVHYVPVKWDLSDLFEKLNWVKAHDNQAREISQRAKQIGEHIFSPYFMACYAFCTLKQYHKKLNIDMQDKLLHSFVEVHHVCNSKLSKRNHCSKVNF